VVEEGVVACTDSDPRGKKRIPIVLQKNARLLRMPNWKV
jgi:hypothetical protein